MIQNSADLTIGKKDNKKIGWFGSSAYDWLCSLLNSRPYMANGTLFSKLIH